MAIPSDRNDHFKLLNSKVHVEVMQSVMPSKPTDPRKSHAVLLAPHNHKIASKTLILRRRFHSILCYEKSSDEDCSGWLMAGFIRESLGKALVENPIFAGRLRPFDDPLEDNDLLTIVSNDSGVRMVEARVDMRLNDFLENIKSTREDQVELVFWEDVDEQNPQYSPLFYVQVTNFSCGGYSIGISCSLLLADPFALTTFVKKWADLHENNVIISTSNATKTPTFYFPSIKNKTNSLVTPSVLTRPSTHKTPAQSIVFEIPARDCPDDDDKQKIINSLIASCVVETEQELGLKMSSEVYYVFYYGTNGGSEDMMKVELCSRDDLQGEEVSGGSTMSCRREWDELGLNNISFNGGKKPVYGSCWINSSNSDQGFVMMVPSLLDDGNQVMKIVVAHD